MRILGREIRWSEPASASTTQTRELDQIEWSDIGIAFTETELRMLELSSVRDISIPAVYRSQAIITDLGSSLPLRSVGRDGLYEPITPEMLEQPNLSETYNSTMSKVISSLVLRGNAYLAPIQRSQIGLIERWVVLNPDEVSVAWNRNRTLPIYAFRNQPMERNEEIFHIPINLWPGELVGHSPISAARRVLRGVVAEQEMSRRLFEDEATPSGLLLVPKQLEKEEAEAVQEAWIASHGNGRKRPAVLSGGVDFKPLTISPIDAQFIEQRNFGIQEIARIFGIPGILLLVGSGDSLTYSTTEGLLRMFLVTTLRPGYLEKIEATLTMMLPAGLRAVFDPRELLEPDIATRYSSYETGLRAGFLTIDDVREELHLPRIEPGAAQSSLVTQTGGGAS